MRALFGESVHHCYIPFEFPHAVNNFFRRVNPEAALIMETEIWPNLYRACGVREVPLILVSARISPKSVPGYGKLLPLIRETLSHGIIIAAQSQDDADRFLSLGANPSRTCVEKSCSAIALSGLLRALTRVRSNSSSTCIATCSPATRIWC